MAKTSLDGMALKALLGAGVEHVWRQIELINQLNVFPVPDGDTGINMYHTLKRAYQEIAILETDDVSLIADRFAYGALMGARGNSGTILSQLLKGFAEGLEQAEKLTPQVLLSGCQRAVARAYAAVSKPAEGTILTVAREAVESLQGCDLECTSLSQMLGTMIAAASISLENTPNLLPILQEAGVVDAGGMGLLCFLQGMAAGQNEAAMEIEGPTAGTDLPSSLTRFSDESYGYDVQFLMRGSHKSLPEIRRDLEQMGWSVLVVGDESAIKVHIHVDNPALPLDFAVKSGAVLDDIVVENMQLQYQRMTGQKTAGTNSDFEPAPEVAVIAVAEGDGFQALYRDLNCAVVIDGGAGKNPATEDFIRVINTLSSQAIIILPNDRNIVMAAQQATRFIADKQIRTVPTETVLQGIGAMIAYGDATDNGANLDIMAEQMKVASAALTSIEIARATHATQLGELDIRENDHIALIDGKIKVASDDIESTLFEALKIAGADKELATVYYGAGLSNAAVNQLLMRLAKTIDAIEFEAVYGGQSLYPFLISVE